MHYFPWYRSSCAQFTNRSVYQRINQSLRALDQRSFHCELGALSRGVSCLNCFVSTSHSIVRWTNISCNIKNIIYAMVSVPSAKHAQKCCTEASYVSVVHSLQGCLRLFFLTIRKRCSIWVIHQSKEYNNYDF